jgi:hypothetical protein
VFYHAKNFQGRDFGRDLKQLLFVHIFLQVRIIVRLPFLFTPPKVFVTPEDGMSSLFVPPPIPPKGGLKTVDLQLFNVFE